MDEKQPQFTLDGLTKILLGLQSGNDLKQQNKIKPAISSAKPLKSGKSSRIATPNSINAMSMFATPK